MIQRMSQDEMIRDLMYFDFSYNGADALIDMLEDFDPDRNWDPVEISCTFSEYEDFEEIKEVYPDIETISDLVENTLVVEFKNGIIIQDY
jgi:hypothetical protein